MPSIPFVILMGIGVVFFGLICLVLITKIVSIIVRAIEKKTEKTENPIKEENTPVSAETKNEKPSKEIIVAVSAACAEFIGKDLSGIRIRSIKKIQ